jgi:ATP-dependent Lon protease
LGKVLQESVNIIHSWIKSNKRTLQIDKDIIKQNIHVHLPDGSTPKDGPSAGIAIAVSIISSMRKVPVRNDIAMTGEVTLRGRVKEIGKVREKILAAHRAGIFNVIIPKENEKDLEELPEEVKKEVTIFPVTELGDALKLVFKEE